MTTKYHISLKNNFVKEGMKSKKVLSIDWIACLVWCENNFKSDSIHIKTTESTQNSHNVPWNYDKWHWNYYTETKYYILATCHNWIRWSSGRALIWCVGGCGFNSWPGHTKDFKMVTDASLLSAQHSKVKSRAYGWFPPLSTVKGWNAMCLRYSIQVWQQYICYK